MLKPTKNNVIVTEEKEKLSETLVIPESAQARNQLATVVAVGPKVVDITVGDRVLVAVYGGTPIEHGGETLRLIDDGSVMALVTKNQ